MDVAERDRAFSAVKFGDGVAHCRHDTALQQVLRLSEIEPRRVDAVVCRRVVLFERRQHRFQKAPAILLVAERHQLFEIASGDVFHQKRGRQTAERPCRNHDHLAVAGRNRQRHVHGIGMLHAAVKADEQPALRLGERRVFGPVSKQLNQRIAAARHDQEIEARRKRGDLVILDAAVFDFAAAVEKATQSRSTRSATRRLDTKAGDSYCSLSPARPFNVSKH